jgi:hypothetical protein
MAVIGGRAIGGWPLLVLASPLLVLTRPAVADLPISVEDIFTAHQRYRFESKVEYANFENSDLSGAYLESSDVSALSLGMRYGWTLRTEVYGQAYGYYAASRRRVGTAQSERSGGDFSRLVLGVNHLVSADNNTPALLAFFGLNAVEKPQVAGADTEYAKGATIGLTSYRSLDPLLLSAVFRYDYQQQRNVGGHELAPGDSLSLSPQVAFAVNHLVTLTGGINWEWHDSPRYREQNLSIDRTRTSLVMGIGYNWSEDVTVSFNGKFAVTDAGGSSLGVTLVYKFDDSISL